METKKYKIKKTAFILLAFSLAINSFSQEEISKKREKISGGFGNFNFTAQSINIGGLNNMLSGSGYGQINPLQFSWGGGGNFVIKNFMIGGEGAGFFGASTSNANNSINFTGGYGQFNVGYMISTGKHSVLYPMIGAGGAGFSFLINQKNTKNSFYDQINSPTGSLAMDAGGLILNAHLAYQYFFCGHATQGFFAGFKAGYTYSPNSWKLNIGRNELNDSPLINMNGFYATVIFGGGNLIKSK